MPKGKPQRPPPTPPKLARRVQQVPLKILITVSCEGITEKRYIDEYKRRYGASVVEVEVVGQCGDPRKVVEHARKQLKRSRSRIPGERLLVQSWAVVDIDEHDPTRLAEARDMAKANVIGLAISNPCVELWAVLHLADQTAWIHRHDCQSRLHALMPSYHHDHNPTFDPDLLHEKDKVAQRRAIALEQSHASAGKPGANPSTDLWRLCEAIRTGEAPRGTDAGAGERGVRTE